MAVTTILRVLASPRPASTSRRIACAIAERMLACAPAARLLDRDLARDPPPHPDGDFADAIVAKKPPCAALARSEEMIAELEAADGVVIGTPMHNFTLPSSLKAWIDHVVRIDRTFRSTRQGKTGLLRDRPVIVVVAQGGFCGDAPPLQPDHLTPYLRAILNTIGIDQVEFVRLEGLSRGAAQVEATLSSAHAWIDKRWPPAERRTQGEG
jgi:FMN-dependent NADH-azoreductase